MEKEKETLPWGAVIFGGILILLLFASAILLPRGEELAYQKPGVPDKIPLHIPPPSPQDTSSSTEELVETPEVQVHTFPTYLANGSVIEGEARGYWFFEASFPIELRDEKGSLIAVAIAQADGDWMTEEFVPFRATFHFSPPRTTTGTLVFKKDNPSGLPEHDRSIEHPITILSAPDDPGGTNIYLGFISEKEAEERDCTRILSAVRTVPKTPAIAKATIEELLKGPTIGEVGDGMLTIIPTGTKLLSLIIKDGVATADFNEKLPLGGGSCAVGAIRSQITETLKQFPSIQEVIISVNGETKGILEP